MKYTILAPALALSAGLALAQNPDAATAQKSPAGKHADHKMTAEVVSTDATAQQITVRKLSMKGSMSGSTTDAGTPPTADAPTLTLKVEGKALTRLSSLKSGDRVTISCQPGSLSESAGSAGATAGTGPITSQAMADRHCASVTDLSPANKDTK